MDRLASALRALSLRGVPPQRNTPSGQRRPGYRPEVELLDERWLPALILWTGAVNDDWSTAGNWNLARLPTADDDVQIGARPAVLKATASATVKTVSMLGNGDLTVEGWLLTGQAINTGKLVVKEGGTLEINRTGADALVINSGTIQIAGSIEGSVLNKKDGQGTIEVTSFNATVHGNLKNESKIFLADTNRRLRVLGDFEQTVDGTLAETADLKNQTYISSLLAVSGNAKLAGSLQMFSKQAIAYPRGTQITPVIYLGNHQGTFKEMSWDVGFSTFLPHYDNNALDLYVPLLARNWPTDNFTNRFTEAFVAEGRIGNAGNDTAGNFTFELDVGRTTSAPAKTGDFDWDPGTYSFALTYDPTLSSNSVSLTVSGATGTKTVSFQFDPATWATTENDALFLRTRAVRSGSGIVLSDLQLATPGLGRFIAVNEPAGPNPAQVAAVGPDARNSLQVMGTDLQQGFTLTGQVAWSFPVTGTNVPKQSELAFQLKVGTWQNAAPTATADLATTTSQAPVNIAVLANDADPEGDALTILILSQPSFGTAVVNQNGTPADPNDDFITYTPDTSFHGSDTFTYAVRDQYGAVSTATVTITEFMQGLDAFFAEEYRLDQSI